MSSTDPSSTSSLATLLPPHWKEVVVRWIQEDMPKWDVGGYVVGEEPHHAMLLGKSEGVWQAPASRAPPNIA